MQSTFGERLLAIIKYRGYTQSSFAMKIGIPISTLNSYIKTNREPSYEMLHRFCDALDCSTDYLLDCYCGCRQYYLDNKAFIVQHLTTMSLMLKINSILIIAWFEGQIELYPKDVLAIQKFLSVDEKTLAKIENDTEIESHLILTIKSEYVASLLNKLSQDELEDVEKYIDFILSKRKS